MSDVFELYDLRVVVDRIEGRSTCGLQVGDYFELTESSRLRIPADKHFCIFAIGSVLALLAAKQRQLDPHDWLETDTLVSCPDPDERLIMRIERIAKRTLHHDEFDVMAHEISIAFQTDKSAAAYIALAKLVNAYDFDAVSLYCDAPYHPAFAPLMLMAPHIARARVGVAAVSPSRVHPLDIAAQTALLAELARGGVYLGIARGAWLRDHAIREHQPALQAIRETVAIVRYMLSGQDGGYQGTVYQLAEHVRAPYPVPAQPVPILIGTWGQQLGAIAGEIADEVKIGGSANPDFIPVMREYVAIGEQRAGRVRGSVRIVAGAVSVINEDRGQARQAARRAVALYLPVVATLDPTVTLEPGFIERLETHVRQRDWDAAAGLISDDLLDRFAISGNPHDVIEQAQRLFAAGVGRIEFGTPHGLPSEAGIHLLGRKVIPVLRRTWPG